MVIADRLKSDNSFRVSITPNRSISWRGNLIFVFLVSVPLTIIALGFLYVGAPIILPFAGLEILLVLTAWYPLHIVISSKGERVPIGDFLTEEDKKILIEKMDEIIQELRTI